MKLVLDSCVAFKWEVVEPDTDKARRLRDDFRKGAIELLAPDFFPVEAAHAITRAERQGRLTPAEGASALAALLTDLPNLHASLPLLPRAYAISSAARIGVYDCVYVALAEREKCDFVTSDSKLLTNLGPQFPFIKALSSLP